MKNKSTAEKNNNERVYKPLKELNLCDDFLFDVVTEDIQSCKDILEIILGREIKAIYNKEGQKVIHNLPSKRGIRMDFYVEDMDGNLFDVEMQKDNTGNIPKRTRFYKALIDSPLLKSGEETFDNLSPTYVIVICNFDLYGFGLYRYSFTNLCREVPDLEMGDKCETIILNTKGKNIGKANRSLVEFLQYVRDSSEKNIHPDSDEKLKRLHRKICEIKNSEQMEVAYMKMEERDRLIKKDGMTAGANKLGRLISVLISEGKIDDVSLVSQDEFAREEYYEQYGIED